MVVVIYPKGQIDKNLDQLALVVEFFGYGEHSYCKKIVANSQVFAVAWKGDTAVGFGRIVGDGVRFGYIVDLNVKNSDRRKGIGTNLAQELAKNSGTHYVELTNDPQFPWLKDFYVKAGFKLCGNTHVFEWSK
jgi:ribosomal protein S18 acetylase RimI-like enzyme